MFRTIAAALLALGLAAPAFAQTADVTATCKDGTTFSVTQSPGSLLTSWRRGQLWPARRNR